MLWWTLVLGLARSRPAAEQTMLITGYVKGPFPRYDEAKRSFCESRQAALESGRDRIGNFEEDLETLNCLHALPGPLFLY